MCTYTRLLLPVILFIGGMGLIAASVVSGEADISLVVIFPVFSGTGGMFLTGVMLVGLSLLLGFVLTVTGQAGVAEFQQGTRRGLEEAGSPAKRKMKYGGVVLVGPFPIAFGSNMRLAIIMMVVGIALALVTLAVVLTVVD